MKTALAIVCSLMLALTNVLFAQAAGAGAVNARPSCHCGKKTSCCATKSSLPESSPVSAAPAPSLQNQFSLMAPEKVAWALPVAPARELPPSFSSSLSAAATALFARDCAWLI